VVVANGVGVGENGENGENGADNSGFGRLDVVKSHGERIFGWELVGSMFNMSILYVVM